MSSVYRDIVFYAPTVDASKILSVNIIDMGSVAKVKSNVLRGQPCPVPLNGGKYFFTAT